MKNIYLHPSFYAHILNGILLFIAIILLYKNYYKISRLEPYKQLILVLVFSIGAGIHGLSHQGLEKNYNFYPLSI
jgi:hypothetical protein